MVIFMDRVYHELGPIYTAESRVLILGTMPSPKSREVGFYYGHPQNRFWNLLGEVYNVELLTKEDKIAFLYQNKIALWDVIASCDIKGASDQSIHNVVANDIEGLLKKTNIQTIFCTGKKSYELYQKYIYPKTRMEATYLPSTSPANCSVSYETLLKHYSQIKG